MKEFGVQADYIPEEDVVIGVDCLSCGAHSEGYEAVNDHTCELCGSTDVTLETAHEGTKCSCCGGVFDCWEKAYRNTNNGKLICEECHAKLK